MVPLESPAKTLAYATVVRMVSIVVIGGAGVIPSAVGMAIGTILQIYTIHCVSRGKCRTWAWTMAGIGCLIVALDILCAVSALRNGVPVGRRWSWIEEKVVEATAMQDGGAAPGMAPSMAPGMAPGMDPAVV